LAGICYRSGVWALILLAADRLIGVGQAGMVVPYRVCRLVTEPKQVTSTTG